MTNNSIELFKNIDSAILDLEFDLDKSNHELNSIAEKITNSILQKTNLSEEYNILCETLYQKKNKLALLKQDANVKRNYLDNLHNTNIKNYKISYQEKQNSITDLVENLNIIIREVNNIENKIKPVNNSSIEELKELGIVNFQ